MDIERVVAERLMRATGIECVLDVPSERPAEFVQVALAATSATRFIQSPRVLATSWAKTRRRAREIADAVERACSAIEDEPNVFSAVSDGTYRWDDPDTGTPRYQTNINLTICE